MTRPADPSVAVPSIVEADAAPSVVAPGAAGAAVLAAPALDLGAAPAAAPAGDAGDIAPAVADGARAGSEAAPRDAAPEHAGHDAVGTFGAALPAARPLRVSDRPDWGYLLREFYELYRFASSGGSPRIRAHQRAVREAVSAVMRADSELHLPPPAEKPVTAHLRRALDQGRMERHGALIRGLDAVAPSLSWQYGYEKVPRGLDRKYAYAEIAAPRGPVLSERVILGLVLFAPGCTYPAHAHDGITESYVTLSGAVSENHHGVYAPGSLIFNPPGETHRITVSDREPSLLAYAWIGPQEKLAHQKMVFSRSRPGR